MSVNYTGQIQTTIKEIIRRHEGQITREELVAGAKLELSIDRGRVESQLDKLDRKGEIYHVGDGDRAEVRVP